MTNNQTIIEAAFEERSKITPENVSADIKDAINQTIDAVCLKIADLPDILGPVIMIICC